MESDYCGTMSLSGCFSTHPPEATSTWETNPSSQKAPWRRKPFLPPQVGQKMKLHFPSLRDTARIFPKVDMGQGNWYGMFWNIIKCSQEMQPTDTRTLNELPLLLKTESDNHVKNFYSTHTISFPLATGLLILYLLQQTKIIIYYSCALCSLSTLTVTAQRSLCKPNPREFSHKLYFYIFQK